MTLAASGQDPQTHPRIIVRQLVMGTAATSERIPLAWLTHAPDSATLEREYRELAGLAAVPPLHGDERAARASLLVLGIDGDGRTAVRGVLSHIMEGSSADPVFRATFRRDGQWEIDLHDAVRWEAPHYQVGFQLANAADGLRALHELDAGAADSAAMRQSAWRLWSDVATADSGRIFKTIDTLARHDPLSANAVRALLAGFTDATAWWRRALLWLLTNPWLDTSAGRRSPAQLMAAFWGVDSLPLPEIRDQRYGAAAAMPMLSVEHIGPWLFTPGNAVAGEWLSHGGITEAFAKWRTLRWGESPPLSVIVAGRSSVVASPSSQAAVHPASFFGDRDAIRIDPGMTPLAAVAAFLHEWNHLLASQRRLAGTHPIAVISTKTQLQLRDDDPWLAEGFAEWATEEVLRPAGASAAFLRMTQAEKRLGIAESDPDDPHVLGYRIVRAAALTNRAPALRDLAVRYLHDLDAFSRAAGLATGGPGRSITLPRPATAVVIPEVTFTWVEGSVLDLSRRLLIPNIRPEH